MPTDLHQIVGHQLVDNLTTDDATKGLSAKQGKVLNDTKSGIDHKHDATDITSGQFGAERIADSAITNSKIKDGEISRAKFGTTAVFTGATSSADGAQGTVPAPAKEDYEKFLQADGTWTSIHGIPEGGTLGQLIIKSSATDYDIAWSELDEDSIKDGAITADKLATDSVTEIKIKNGSVTENKIATDAVTEAKIKNEAVTTNKIKDATITNAKIVSIDAETKLTGIIPAANLPSYVDDVLEYDTRSEFPTTGEAGKLYVAKDSNMIYRWTGTTYAETSTSLALGETHQTAYYGDYGKVAYDHATAKGSAHTEGFYKIASNSEGHVTTVTAVAKSDITDLGIPEQDTTYTASNGITLTGTNFTNSGVRAVAEGTANGTISVNTNGTSANVAVHGLEAGAFAATYAGSSTAGGSATSAEKLNTNAGSVTQPIYFANGIPVITTYLLQMMTGATATTAGAYGLVPAPAAGSEGKVLKGDGTWGSGGSTVDLVRW